MTEQQVSTNGAETVVWNLDDLYAGFTDPAFELDMASFPKEAEAFFTANKNKIATCTDAELVEILDQFEKLNDIIGRLYSYTHLIWATDSSNPEYGKQLQRVSELDANTARYMQFVHLELGKLSEVRQQQLLNSSTITHRKRWLENIFLTAQHQLPEDVENALAIKTPYSTSAWSRLHDELVQQLEFPFGEEILSLPGIMQKTSDVDRNKRKQASESLGIVLEKASRTQAFIFNTVIADYASSNKLRGYPTWVTRRNQANEVSDHAVEAMIESVVKNYDLVRRFFTLKKEILGLSEMYDYDRAAPIGKDARVWTWDEARELVSSAYHAFDPRIGEIVDLFFEKKWIHAPVSKGKATGAFSAPTVSAVHPYILMNFTGTTRDVQVLAHELGHGAHQYLARVHGVFGMHTPLTIAETASVFGEMIAFTEIMKRTESDTERLTLLMGKIEDIISTVFRQIALNRFENKLHLCRAEEGELSLDRIRELWIETQQSQFGGSITFTKGYENYWSYISHFIHNPGYVYAYAFGELLTLALYEEYQSGEENFQEKYIELLTSGSSKSPTELLAPFGINPEGVELWERGLKAIEHLIQNAEELAEKVRKEAA